MEPNGKKYWFPAKKYGWGWGAPKCWQGWTVLAVWIAVSVVGSLLTMPNIPAFIVLIIILCVIMTAICWWKGEPPRWRWGK